MRWKTKISEKHCAIRVISNILQGSAPVYRHKTIFPFVHCAHTRESRDKRRKEKKRRAHSTFSKWRRRTVPQSHTFSLLFSFFFFSFNTQHEKRKKNYFTECTDLNPARRTMFDNPSRFPCIIVDCILPMAIDVNSLSLADNNDSNWRLN